MIVNGHIYPQVDQTPELSETYRQLPILLRNDGGKLAEVSRTAGPGFQTPVSARGLAVGDYDDYGDLDLLVTVMDGPPLLLRNDSPRRGHWLRLRLLNRHGSPAINVREAQGGQSLTDSRAPERVDLSVAECPRTPFRAGEAATIDTLEIHWPGGGTKRLEGVQADRVVTVRQD